MLEKLSGHKFSVTEDPNYPGFFSVYADKDGSGAEVAGKIGEREVADAIADALNQLCVEKAKITVLVTHEIDEQRVRDLLCSAWEGGSSYWCRLKETDIPPTAKPLIAAEPEMYSHIYPFIPGVTVTLEDTTGEDSGHGNEWTLTREKLVDGLQVMATKYPRHFNNFMEEDDDAETGDVFLQCCLFGEIVFG